MSRNVKILKIYRNISKFAFAAHFEILRCSIELIPVVENDSRTIWGHERVFESVSKFNAVVSVQRQISIPHMTVLLFT